MKTQTNSNNPQMAAVATELSFLRNKVKSLEAQLKAGPVTPAPTKDVVVETRIDPKALIALRDLLVASENHFGPDEVRVQGEKKTVITRTPKAMKEAMEAAAKFVRKEKKP